MDEIEQIASTLYDDVYICEDCGKIMSEDHAHYSEYDDGWYCGCCIDEHTGDGIIEYYHANKGAFRFMNIGEDFPEMYRGLEVELETDINDSVLSVLNAADRNLFRFEEDGSLLEGFEIITAPMSKDYWLTRGFPALQSLIGDLKNFSNATAWQGGRCGLHVHFNRVEVSNDAEKVLKRFMVENSSFIRIMSGREDSGYCRPPSYDDYDFNSSGELFNYSRYLSLNFTSETIEFRFFRGTLKTESIYYSVAFLETLLEFCEFAAHSGIEYPREEHFIQYVNSFEPELNEFKNTRRAIHRRRMRDE